MKELRRTIFLKDIIELHIFGMSLCENECQRGYKFQDKGEEVEHCRMNKSS